MSKKKQSLKVMTVVGTRPEIIRLSRTIALLDQHVHHTLIHTGQNYDFELNGIFFRDLGIRKPDHFLDIDSSSPGKAVGDVIRKTEEVLLTEKPDALLILGDTNSCLAAYPAKRMHIPIFHMEAGNRCFDLNVPEEINRKIVDHISDFNLVYTEHARRHLLSEGLPHRRIFLTGSPLKEVLDFYSEQIHSSDILKRLKLKPSGYFLVSLHREENVGHDEHFVKILSIFNRIAGEFDLPLIVSTHPRTRKRMETRKTRDLDKRIIFHKPFGYHDYVHLQLHAACVISDSGSISEESAILRFPPRPLRQSMERPEAQDAGSIILTGFDEQVVIDSIKLQMKEKVGKQIFQIPREYQITDTSRRVLKLILGHSKLSNIWDGTTRSHQ